MAFTLRRWAAVFVLLVLALLLISSPASAHTDLLQASPGPNQRAGGEIDFVDLVFLEPVTDAMVTVRHNGDVIPGETTVTDGSIIRFMFDDALTRSGTYEVTYEMKSFDLDDTKESFSFTFEPDAPQAQRIGVVEPVGTNWPRVVAIAVLVASLAGLAFLLLSRVERKRRLATARAEDHEIDGYP